MSDASKMLDFAKEVAREAGPILLKYFDAADKGVEIKRDATPVTMADKLINQLVLDRVAAAFPGHGVLAEEGSEHADRKRLWVCDPLDGTKSYIQRIPIAMFTLTYVVDGRPEAAVMLDPFQDKLFSAARGQGARANEWPITVSARDELSGSTVAVVGGYQELKDRRPFLDGLLERGVKPLLVPGAAFRESLVATGHIDGCIFPGRSAHDVAAAKLIVEEAGGKVTDLYGKEQRYDGKIYGAIITNGRVHDQLVGLLAQFGPENYIGY